jgi:phage shock protein C
MRDYKSNGPYRSRSGMILGVCKGLAQHFNLSVFWTRIVAVGFLIFTGIWPIAGIYLLAGLLMKLEPVVPFTDESDREFYNSYAASRTMALHRIKRTYDNLDRRLRRLEDVITNKEYDWFRRFNQSK